MRADLLVAGKYRLVRELGAGAMGVVWLARNELVDREFAIKFLHPATSRGEEVLARFFQEAKILGRLRHPSLLEIVDVGKAAELFDAPYLVMELLEGIPLDGALRGMGPIPLPFTLLIMLEIARALALAHEKGIVHRDVKPANIFLHRPGNGALVPKVVDFGISKIIGATGDEPGLSLTRTGAMMGSPLYMSPEQAASDKSLDARSDVHALGVVMWECLVGKPPFLAPTFNLLMVQIVTGERPVLRDVMPEAPASIEALLSKAIARERGERFANAGEFAAALEREMASLGVTQTLDQRTTANHFFSMLSPEAMLPSVELAPTEGAVAAATYVSKRKRAATNPPASLPPEPLAASHVASSVHVPSSDAPAEALAPAPKGGVLPYLLVGGAIIGLVVGVESYLARLRSMATVEREEPNVVVTALSAAPPSSEPSVVDAGPRTSSTRPTRSPSPPASRLPATPPAKGDFRRGVSGDGF